MIQWIFWAFFFHWIPCDFSTNTISMGNNFDNCDFRIIFFLAQKQTSKHHSRIISFIIMFFRLQLVSPSTVRMKKWNVSYLALQNSPKVPLLVPAFLLWVHAILFMCNSVAIALIVVEVFYQIINMSKYQSNCIVNWCFWIKMLNFYDCYYLALLKNY